MAEKVQAAIGTFPSEEEATVAAEAKLNELLEEGHRVIRTDIEPTEAGFSTWVTYERLTPEEMATEEAAAAAAAVGGISKGWAVVLALIPLTLAAGGIVYAAVRR